MTPILDILPPAKTLVNNLNPWRKTPCQLLVAVREVLVEAGWDFASKSWYCVWGPRDTWPFGGPVQSWDLPAGEFISEMSLPSHEDMIAAAELAVNLTVRAQHRCFEEEVRA